MNERMNEFEVTEEIPEVRPTRNYPPKRRISRPTLTMICADVAGLISDRSELRG